jgi:CRISPR-associated protein (TIGR02584 family)
VVTETLYALCVRGRPRRSFGEIHLIETQPSLERAAGTLLGRDGAVARLFDEYGLAGPGPRIDLTTLHPISRADGRPIQDIATTEDSAAAGDAIVAVLRDLKAAGADPLYASVAGGRKTMSVLMALAFQLVAGPRDRLVHVLVSEPFDRVRGFFYPTRRRRLLPAPEGWSPRKIRADRAEVYLHDIPTLKPGPDGSMAPEPASAPPGRKPARRGLIAEVEGAQAALDAAVRPRLLRIEPSERTAWIGPRPIKLTPVETALYLFYALQRRACLGRHRGRPACPRCFLDDGEIRTRAGEIVRIHDGIRTRRGAPPEGRPGLRRWAGAGASALDDGLLETRSRINGKLRRAIPDPAEAALYVVAPGPGYTSYHDRRRGLRLAPALIKVAAKVDSVEEKPRSA